jgi:antitoxin (DNA-binding transcriptional repressor) of toxin-antitoxin stability system
VDLTVLKAKSNLSSLLRRAEAGEPVFIRRGRKGPRFRIVPERDTPKRVIEANPQWKGKIVYADEAIWESEWREDS